MIDQYSVKLISKLHPKLRNEALAILDECDRALTGRAKVRVTSTLRTMKEQQDLYNQGRTTKGAVVTNAKPGQSFHNFGMALDFALLIDGKEISWNVAKDYDADGRPDWMEVVTIFKKHGWGWGGDWKTILDRPHFEKPFGMSLMQLRKIHSDGKLDKDGYLIF